MNRHLTEQELLGAAFELEEGETLRAHQTHLAECADCRRRADALKARIEQIELLRDDVRAPEPLVARTLAALQPAEAPGRLILWPRAVALLASAAAVTVLAFWQPWKKSLPAQPDSEWSTAAVAPAQAAPAGSMVAAPAAIAEPAPVEDALDARGLSGELRRAVEVTKAPTPTKAERARTESPAAFGGGLPAPADPAMPRANELAAMKDAEPPAPPKPVVAAAPVAAPAPSSVQAPRPIAPPPAAVAAPAAKRSAAAPREVDADSTVAEAVAFSLPAAAPMERPGTATATGQVLRIRIPDGNRIVNETPAPGVTIRLVRIGSRIEVVTQNRSASALTLSLLAPQTGQSLRTFSIGASATATNRLDLPASAPAP